jgi:citrate/tricarballylate utilization protein
VLDNEWKLTDLLAEAQRQVDICNGCRYCEGYCAVFPAMERLPTVSRGQLNYLANLCHDCRACHQACPYTPPHEFAVEIPRLMSASREHFALGGAQPALLARIFRKPAAVAAVTAAGVALFAVLAAFSSGGAVLVGSKRAANFYDVVSYSLMLVPMLLFSAFAVGVIGIGVRSFWREASQGRQPIPPKAWPIVLRELATLRWLRGGGGGCYYPDAEAAPSGRRRWLHHCTAYGFGFAFLATCLAAVYQDIAAQRPPYPLFHPVVVAGVIGGVLMLIGTVGLLRERFRASPLTTPTEVAFNSLFLMALSAAAITGMLLLVLRSTSLMAPLLVVHLGVIAALFVTAPYSKMVHVAYRVCAVLVNARDRLADELEGAGARHVEASRQVPAEVTAAAGPSHGVTEGGSGLPGTSSTTR